VVQWEPKMAAGLGDLCQALERPVFVGGALSERASAELASHGAIPTGSEYHRALALIEREVG
ncbi:MAG TPA: hypothetical protein VKA64_06665, partial [Gammaproteobacteria bacterium]|nr:hypothetical protein [Gammaproteobacteria bacterium]